MFCVLYDIYIYIIVGMFPVTYPPHARGDPTGRDARTLALPQGLRSLMSRSIRPSASLTAHTPHREIRHRYTAHIVHGFFCQNIAAPRSRG